jgi:acetaldehyde dehydrogenase (acetylating)
MGGWTKYALQNSYSEDEVKCSLAGIKSAIKVYQMGNGLKKDKQMEKIIELDSKNELKNWITEQLKKK